MQSYSANIFGVIALVLFAIAWIGAAASFFLLLRPRWDAFTHAGFSVWRDPSLRWRFLVFLAFGTLGPLSVLIGFTLGGWPMR